MMALPNEKEVTPSPERSFPGFRIGDWTVSPSANQLSRDEETVRLEPRAMDVLVYLAHRPAQVVSRDELEAAVWPGLVVGYDSVAGAIQKLRRALHDDSRNPSYIETLSKRGYRLIADVQPVFEPVEVAALEVGESAGPARAAGSWRRIAGVGTLIVLSTLAVVAYRAGPGALTGQSAPGYSAPVSAPKAIAVLPFDNLSDDPKQEYFADGMTDDLITGLAKNRDLLVIARDSSFFYKGYSADVREIADQLDVDLIVRGSVQRSGERIRVNAQLVDATTGSHLWAERYDGQIGDVFDIQDKITGEIVGVLSLKMNAGQGQELGNPPTADPLAYDLFLAARQHFYRYNKTDNEKARQLLEQAIGHDPGLALAYAMLAWTHAFDAMNGWTDDRDRSLSQARDLATQALGLQKSLPIAYFVRGLAYREQGEYVKAMVEAETAIQYDPSYANAHVLLSTLLYYAGRPEEGLERIQQAIKLNPHHPYNYSFHLGQAYFVLRRYEEAIDAFQGGLATNPSSERLHVWLAASLAQSGRTDEAEWEAEQVYVLDPDFSLDRMAETFPFKDPEEIDHFLAGLRKAGF